MNVEKYLERKRGQDRSRWDIIPGTPVFTHYTSARRWYAPRGLAKVNNSKIERVTEMGIKKKLNALNLHGFCIVLQFFAESTVTSSVTITPATAPVLARPRRKTFTRTSRVLGTPSEPSTVYPRKTSFSTDRVSVRYQLLIWLPVTRLVLSFFILLSCPE